MFGLHSSKGSPCCHYCSRRDDRNPGPPTNCSWTLDALRALTALSKEMLAQLRSSLLLRTARKRVDLSQGEEHHNRSDFTRSRKTAPCPPTSKAPGAMAARRYDLSKVGAGPVVMLTTAGQETVERHDHVVAYDGGV